jgi:AcrR family transcriptional regulator
LAGPLPTQQERSRRTRDALVAAAWALLQQRPWQEITVADIAAGAGCSVGSFYSRFKDKDAFFESLTATWLEQRIESQQAVLAGLGPADDVLGEAILGTYRFLMRHRHFWRAALVRGAADPAFWAPFRIMGRNYVDDVVDLCTRQRGAPLTPEEVTHLRFAFQMGNGVINNSIVNAPGPLMPDTPEFETQLVRGLKAVAGLP